MEKKNRSSWAFLGSWGFFWRAVVFLLGLALISFLLALLAGRLGDSAGRPDRKNPFDGGNPISRVIGRDDRDSLFDGRNRGRDRDRDRDRLFPPGRKTPPEEENPYQDYPRELWEPEPVQDWNDSIPGVPELPAPRDNYIPPVDSTDVIDDPENPYNKIIGDQLIVFFNSTDIKADMTSFAQQFKANYPDPAYQIAYYNVATASMLLSVPAERLMQTADELPSKIRGIDFRVTTNDVLNESAKPSDPGFAKASYDEYFRLIQAYEAWDITVGSPDVKVAIVDSYFDLTNPEIGQRYVDRIHIPSKTTNVLPPAAAPSSENDLVSYCHGSHVAGIAIGAQNNGRGVSGIAPGCSWIPIALGDQLTSFNMMEGLLYAIYHGADVINLSMGRAFSEDDSKIPIGDQVTISKTKDKRGEELWNYITKVANDHNCVICTSAGNESLLMGMDPKNRSTGIVKVEAVDGKGILAPFSNFGMDPGQTVSYSTVAAPGVNLWSVSEKRCIPFWEKLRYTVSASEGLQEMSGTSMASPVVTGAVALLKSKNKNLTSDEVIKILVMTAKQTDQSKKIGPTIQIRDALDATGGDLLNFDDLMKDHNLLIGKWRSTHELLLQKAESGEKLDEIWTYFIFPDTSRGTLEMRCINSHKVYKADVTVEWKDQKVIFHQLTDAISADGDEVNKDDYVCAPNSDRLLEASVVRNGKERYRFMLEKVN